MKIIFSPAQKLQGWKPHQDFHLSLLSSNESVAGSGGSQTVSGITYDTTASTASYTKSDVVVTQEPGAEAPIFTSLTPTICNVNEVGEVGFVSAGACTVEVTGRTGKRRISQTVSSTGALTIYDRVANLAPGSLRKYLQDQQIAALAGVTPGSAAQRAHATSADLGFGNYGAVNTGNFVRAQAQAGFTALPLDALDELLAGNAGSAQWRAWISPHHYLSWFGHGSSSVVGSRVSLNGEICVAWSATPWAGTLCKLLSADYKTKLPDSLVYTESAIAVWARLYNTYISGDKRWVMPAELGQHGAFNTTDSRWPYQKVTTSGADSNYMVTGGDSGSPVFVGINGNLVAVGHTAYRGQLGTEMYADWRTEIDAAMNSLATANGDATVYAAETIDLSGFTSY